MSKSLEHLISLLNEAGSFSVQAEALTGIQNQQSGKELKISVIGQFKRGKSSLINAILGQELLPVAITPLTAVVTEIRYDDFPHALVCFKNGSEKNICIEDIKLYCGEQFNKNNEKNVQSVLVWTPLHPFGEGTVLVDTPGVASTNKKSTDAATEYLTKSDAVVFVLSIDSPVNEAELEFLLKASESAANFYFVVNKSDQLSELELTEYIKYCSEVIAGALKMPVKLHPVSAKQKTGIFELKNLISRDLSISKDDLLSLSISKKLQIIFGQIKAIISVAEKAALASGSELEIKKQRMIDNKKELLSYGETLNVLANHHTQKLVGDIKSTLEENIPELKNRVYQKTVDLDEELKNLSLKEYKIKFQDKLDLFLREQIENINKKGLELLQDGYKKIVDQLNSHTSETEECISKMMLEEFNVNYPVSHEFFEVSEKNDFYFKIGIRKLPLLYTDFADYITNKKTAKIRFLKQCRYNAEKDIECNFNNVIYNYKYKMQESLRILCAKLNERIDKVQIDLDQVISLLDDELSTAKKHKNDKIELYKEILDEIEISEKLYINI